MDPPPPYTATDFHGINAPPTAPPTGPPPAGFVIPPVPAQTGKKIIATVQINVVIFFIENSLKFKLRFFLKCT